MNPRLFSFSGADEGPWRIVRSSAVIGAPLPAASRVAVVAGAASPGATGWTLRGVTSNERYVERAEKEQLVARQQGLGRPEATCAALIPIRKNAAWWALTQNERRAVFEGQSRHIESGLRALPAVARRLHHCRDLSQAEPFDFLTWFEFAPAHEAEFDHLVAELRASAEWDFVDREVDIRLVREDGR